MKAACYRVSGTQVVLYARWMPSVSKVVEAQPKCRILLVQSTNLPLQLTTFAIVSANARMVRFLPDLTLIRGQREGSVSAL